MQAKRYKDVPSAMSYTLIHLSGDYPLIDYTLAGKFLCFLMCLFAVGIVSIPSGIIANGFTDVALKEVILFMLFSHLQSAEKTKRNEISGE